MNKKIYSKNVELCESMLRDQILVDVFKYLSLQDLAKCTLACKMFKNLIEEESNVIFDKINVCVFDNKINLEWLIRIIKNNRVKILNLLLCENYITARLILYNINPLYLEELKIPLKMFMSDEDLIQFKNLKKLTIKNMYFNESGLEEDVYMLANLMQMKWLKYLKLNNIKFLKANFIGHLTNELYFLDFRECVEFTVDDMFEALIKQSQNLKVFRLDGELSSQNVLVDVLKKLNNLNELYLGYCENFSDGFLYGIANLHNLSKLTLRKLRNVTKNSLEYFFENVDLQNIVKLDIYDCPLMTTQCVSNIANKANKLEHLELSWATTIRNLGIIQILKNCLLLKKLYVQGCKYLDDNLFNEFLDSPEWNIINTSFKNLKLIDFSKCDLIEDKTLYKVMKLYPCLNLINYYGNDLKYEV